MRTRHCILTGYGLVTPQGADAAITWTNLLAGQVLHKPAGRVPIDGDGTSRASQLAIRAANEAVLAGRWRPEIFADPRTAIVVGTSKGPIEDWLTDQQAAEAHPPRPRRFSGEEGTPTHEQDPQAPRQTALKIIGLHTIADDLARTFRHGYGPRLTLAAACASGLHALIRASMLIDSNVCDRVLVVAAESSIGPLFQASFRRLGVLADPAIGCRPFDRTRQGFLMSESAAAVCLEASDEATGVRLAAGVMLSDATHLTGIDPAGRSIRTALEAVRGERPIDFVHAHGTGTEMNDPVELAAIETICGDAHPAVYSHKHAIGHTQGAAGLIAVVINLFAHRHSRLPPNANTHTPITQPGSQFDIHRQPVNRTVQQSLCLAAGFGGPVAAVRLESGGSR